MITLKYVSSSTPSKELRSLGFVSPDLEISIMGQISVISAETRILNTPMILACLTLNSTYRLPIRLRPVVICCEDVFLLLHIPFTSIK